MKILYVTTISNTIGFLLPHIKLLIRLGHQVDIACNVIREVSDELLNIGCTVHNIEFQRHPLKKLNYIAYKKIKKLVIKEGYNLVHTHTPIASFLTRLACRRIDDLTVLYTVHGFHFFKGAPIKNWLIFYTMEKVAARWTDGIITMNDEDFAMAKKMKNRGSSAVYKISGVGLNLDKFKPLSDADKIKLRKEYGYKEQDFILFYAAELNSNKHQDLLIEAVGMIKNLIPGVKLLLAGTGNLDCKYRQLSNDKGLINNIIFLGYRKDVPSLLKISDVLVASSRREGLPVNIMEAMSTGLPIIATDCRGQRDLVHNGENGYIINGENPYYFAEAIEKLYDSVELRKKFGGINIESSRLYSIDIVLEEMKQIYLRYF